MRVLGSPKKQLEEAIAEMLAFKNIEPSEPIEHNLGTVWFKDLNSGSQMYLTVLECEE